MNIKKRQSRKSLIIITAAVVAIIGAGSVFAYFKLVSHDSTTKSAPTYAPPTKEEQAAGDKQKEIDIAHDKAVQDAQSQSDGSLTQANIIVTDASYYQYDGDKVEVRAYVSNVYEEGGSCVATFTKGSYTVTATGSPFKDVSTTQCGAMDVARSKFPEAGDWQVVVKYTSATASGQSEAKTVTIK